MSKAERYVNECPKCGGDVKYIEEVSGKFIFYTFSNGEVDFTDKEFIGDSWGLIECEDCGHSPEDVDYDGEKLYFIEEDDK